MIFAIQDHHGTVVGFAARNLNYENDKSLPKYINSSSDSPLYRKREILYGLHVGKAPAVKNGLIIVEGYADWISLQEIGIKNCAAVCGTALTKEHIHLLTGLGISKITICLDNDDGGNLGTLRILDDVITEVPNLQVELIRLPEGSKDPDKYLRNFSPEDRVNAWRNLKPVSCFEWRLAQFPEDMNGEEIAKKMVPLIITEPNLITRERMAKELSKRSDIRLSAIQGQIDKISKIEDYKKSEQLVSIVKTAITDLKKDPGSAREIFSQYLGIIEQTHQASSLDLIGPDEMVNAFNTMADDWAKEKKSNIVGIATHFSNLDEVTNGLQEGRVIGVGGKPNHGKSAFVLSIAHSVASRNPDAIVIVHSTDDNREVVLSRLVAIDQGLDINTITNPRWFLKLRDPIKVEGGKSIVFDPEGQKKWKTGRDNISNLLKNGKLVVKDSSQGSTLGFTETLIKYYKEKFPEKRILVIFDNFHKAQDYMQFDERIRFKKMSHQCKMLAEKYHVAFIATMEYTKLGPGIRPENSDLAETVQMEYDLSIIMHVYNELKDLGKERAKHVTITGEGANAVHQPIVDIRVGKNKQTAFQDRIYFDFDSSKGKFTETTADRVRDILQGQDSSRKLSGLGGSK
jgi:replicative DNA helicase